MSINTLLLPRALQWIAIAAICCIPRVVQAQFRWFRVTTTEASPIAGATVSGGASDRVLAVDSAGYVALADSELVGTVRVRALGFRSVALAGDSLRLATGPADTIIVALAEIAPLLGSVEVTSDRPLLGGASITREVARRLPPLGEPDIFRVLPLIGGIAQPNDIRPRLHLAGAAGDESLVTLDGHPMQHGLHFDGLLGAFNLASLDRADVLMHNVPAATRSRVGGVIALEPRLPESQLRGDVGVSLAAVNATVSSPVGRANVLASARSTWNEELLERVLNDAPTPGFRDGLVRLSVPLGARTEATMLGFAAYNAPRTLLNGVRSGLGSDETLAGVTLSTHALGMRWTARASRSDFRTQRLDRDEPTGEPEARQRWTATSLDAAWSSQRRWLDVHASLDGRDHKHAWNQNLSNNPLLPRSFAQEVQQRLLHTAVAGGTGVGPWSFDGGARLTRSRDGMWLAPQANVQWRRSRVFNVGASLGRRWQFDSQYGEPAPGGDPPPVFLLTRPRRMDAAAVSLAWNGAASAQPRDARLEMSAFVRRFADRSVPPTATSPFVAPAFGADSLAFVRTTGRAYGVSTTLSARSARGASLQLAYTWQRAWQRDSTLDARAAWDIPHTLSTLASTPLGRRFELSGVVSWRSGTAVTPIAGAVLIPLRGSAPFRPRLGELNAARVPDYLRVDAMLRWRGRIAATDVAVNFQLINAFARENVLGLQLDRAGPGPDGSVQPPPETGVPLLPSLGLEIRW